MDLVLLPLASPCVIRSMIMAMMTMPTPPMRPRPGSNLAMPFSTSTPIPFAPIIEAMTTIARAIMMVWLTPAMMVGKAMGSWTLTSI